MNPTAWVLLALIVVASGYVIHLLLFLRKTRRFLRESTELYEERLRALNLRPQADPPSTTRPDVGITEKKPKRKR